MTALARPRPAIIALVFGLSFGSCSRDNSPATGIIVDVTSDLLVPSEINQVHLTGKDPKQNILYEYTFDLGEGQDRVQLPFRVGFYPLHDTSTPIHIEAVGEIDGNFVISRSATLSFVRSEKVVLPLPLLATCKLVTCDAAYSTCKAQGKCEPDTVVSSDLPKYVPNEPAPGPDASTPNPDTARPDIAIGEAGRLDAIFATGGASGSDGHPETGGMIGTDGGLVPTDAPAPLGGARGADAAPEVGTGGTKGTSATGGIAVAGGASAAGGNTGAGGATGGTPATAPAGGSALDAALDASEPTPDVACGPESDQEMCARLGKNCNAFSGTDNCGDFRSGVSCGTCPGTEECLYNVCSTPDAACVPESNPEMCARLGKNCSVFSGTDNCGDFRSSIFCGTCPGTEECLYNVCTTPDAACVPESNPEMCARLGKNCNAFSGTDNCGDFRSGVSCGTCPGTEECLYNVCITPDAG
jgi:hypothetical protein